MFELIVILTVLAPLTAAALNGVNLVAGGTALGWRAVQRITCSALFVSLLGALWIFVQVLLDPRPREVLAYQWLASGGLVVPVAFLIDSLSALMMLVVTGFSFLIAVFSINYMHNDRSFARYFSTLALFVFAMLVLVMGNNFVMLFVGWECVGLCSYLLIGHYYERTSAARAGTKAFVMNRIGDAGFLMGIFLIATNFGTVVYTEVFANIDKLDTATATAIGLCLLLGAVGKSAQLPLGTWLARAMEGPTPSSALIHAATMVTAGIYMIVRSHAIYDAAPDALLVIAIIGALTALYGALVSLTVSDIKGILAFSTTTQLGLMFLACGLGAYSVAIFHLVAHAFLKSFLFLTAPSILHHMHVQADPQAKQANESAVPTHYWLVLLGALGVVLVPFLAGFARTELVGVAISPPMVLAGGAVIAIFATGYYVLRMTQHAFGAHDHDDGSHHAGGGLVKPLLMLALVVAAGIGVGLLPGGTDGSWFRELLRPVLAVQPIAEGGNPVLAYTLLILVGGMLVTSWLTAIFLQRFNPELPGLVLLKGRRLYVAALNRFWLDEFYQRYAVEPTKALGRWLDRIDTRTIDRIVGGPARERSRAPAVDVWEQRYLAAWSGGQQPQPTASAASAASQAEADEVFGRATGAAAYTTTAAAAVSNWTERYVIARGSGAFGWLTQTAARFADLIETHVFGTLVNSGLPATGRLLGKGLLNIEAFLARPMVMGAGAVALASVALAAAVLGVR